MMYRLRVTLLLLSTPFAAPVIVPTAAFAQTTQPAASNTAAEWAVIVDRFTAALVNGDTTAARAVTAGDGLSIVRAGSAEQIDLATVVGRSTGGAVLASHVYQFPPIALAADLAADFKSSLVVTESLKTLMVPQDDEAMTRANATAIQWLQQALGAIKGTPVAIAIVLPAALPDSDKAPIPILVLLKGTIAPDSSVHVSRIVYGTPQQIVD